MPSCHHAFVKERTAAKIADLSWYGAFGYYFFAFLMAGALLGAAVGWIVGDPGDGAAIGSAVGLVCWFGLTVASFRQLRTYEGRRRRNPTAKTETASTSGLRGKVGRIVGRQTCVTAPRNARVRCPTADGHGYLSASRVPCSAMP